MDVHSAVEEPDFFQRLSQRLKFFKLEIKAITPSFLQYIVSPGKFATC